MISNETVAFHRELTLGSVLTIVEALLDQSPPDDQLYRLTFTRNASDCYIALSWRPMNPQLLDELGAALSQPKPPESLFPED